MTSNTCKNQIVKESFDEMLESVLSTPDSDFYHSSDTRSPKKKSLRKKPDSEVEHLNMKLTKKKHKESTKDRLLEWNKFYSNREFGIWIQCTKCNKWRKSLEYEEEHQVPKDWRCSMNISGIKNCVDPEDTEEVEFSETNFIPGSIVWAKLDGFPWWPGMVEDDPDTEEYYWFDENEKMFYNITFLDDCVTHAWVSSSFVQSYLKPLPRNHKLKRKYKNAHLVEDAKEKANAAIKMSIKERLQRFSFAHQFTGKWPRAIDFDDHEESENITKMLIQEVEDMKSLKSSDSENETSSLVAIQENNTHKTNYKESIQSQAKKKKIDIYFSEEENLDEGLENVILNEEYIASSKIKKEKTFISDSKNEIPIAKTIIKDTPSDRTNLKIDKQQNLHSVKRKKKNISANLKSNTENKLQKIPKFKIKENNMEINKKKEINRLEKSKKKRNLEKTDSVIDQENKAVPKKFLKMMKKTAFTPPVRNETEYHKNEVNSTAVSNQMRIKNRKDVNANKNLSSNVNDCLGVTLSELLNEVISSDNEPNLEKSTEPETDYGENMDKQTTCEENQDMNLLNKIKEKIQIKPEISSRKEDTEIITISDEELLVTDLVEAKIGSKVNILENAPQDIINEKTSSKNLTTESNTIYNGENHEDKPTKKGNEILKVLEKNIKNINSKTESLDTKENINKKNKKSSKGKNKTLDMKDKKKENIVKKLENPFKTSKQDKKTCKQIKAVLKTSKSGKICPIKQNKQKNKHVMDVPNTKRAHQPAIVEIEHTSNKQNYAENDGVLKKFKGVGNNSNSLSDSKIKEKSSQSTISSLNCESKTNSYLLCLDNLNEEPSDGEDSDPFEAD